ncbi:MAG: NAD-dependent DNA ligase LigA [Clostridiales bacterium]|nr:NAD-dependent DNA ligase LigA [Clostridiales bacterium]
MTDIERIKELTQLLNHYRNEYYNNANSEISDFEYDRLFDELKEKEEKTGFCLANSPTRTVGYAVQSKLQKSKHEYPMLSLDKTKSPDDLIKFVGGRKALIMLKLDGLTVAITYKNGKMSKAETRGDGVIGEDITENAKTFSNLPLEISYKGKLVVFGEAIIDYPTFNSINKNLPEESKYKNPRNLCSGTVRQLDSKVCAERNVRFIAWRLIEGSESNSFVDRLCELDDYGFEVVQRVQFDERRISECLEGAKSTAKRLGIPIDGCVISFDDIAYGESLGMTGHHLRSQIAFKYDEDRETTVLRGIEWSVGKSGILTPVAIFDSVELAGTTVSRASFHNISVMKNLNIRIGAEVTVVKKNEIIPQIIECDSANPELKIPDVCPVCGGRTRIVKENDSEVLMCLNENCKGKLLGKLTHFVGKSAANIDGLSESTLEKFMELGWLKKFKDIYSLHEHIAEMNVLSGFGEKSVKKLMEPIEKSRIITLDRFINALSIPLIGRTTSKDIAKACVWDFHNFTMIMDLEAENAFIGMDGFGEEMNRSLCRWWSENKNMAAELADLFTFEKPEKSIENNTDLSGQVFVITGSLEHFTNRDELKETIESMGGKVSGSVSAKTTYLINNDLNSTSGKNAKAKQLGIPIVSELDLLKIMGGE